MIDLCLLGCGGSLPVPNRNLTSLLLSCRGKKILIDCGEGTQVSMKMVGWGFKSIDVICFTHAHADHVIGLPGLLLTIANSLREEPVIIIGPPGFDAILKGLMVICPKLPYEIYFVETPLNGDVVFSLDDIDIRSLGVDHTVSCVGYSVELKRSRKFDPLKARSLDIPVQFWSHLQKGENVDIDNLHFTPDMVLGEERKGIKVSYCTDTRPNNSLIQFVKHSNLLVMEGMYGDNNDIDKAIANKHMLFSEAAKIAKNAEVEELWLTHFSPSLTEPENYINNACSIFNNTILGHDRMFKILNF